MKTKHESPTMDEVLGYVSKLTDGKHQHASNAVFYFLYKEILVNRVMILESSGNKAAVEHWEKVINDLNAKLMEQVEK